MEYYLVLDNAPISKEAKGYGTPLENSQGLVFSLEQEGSGAKIIEYEIYKYRVLHHLPLPGNETLHGCAVYAAELYPEYFGMLPVPALTPWGHTTRHRALSSGIYWIETDQCVEALAVSHPAWAADLSEGVLRHARQTDYDTEHGINHTLGYKFFSKTQSCVVIFELLQYEINPELVGGLSVTICAECSINTKRINNHHYMLDIYFSVDDHGDLDFFVGVTFGTEQMKKEQLYGRRMKSC